MDLKGIGTITVLSSQKTHGEAATGDSGVELDDITIKYGDVTAVANAQITVEEGSFFTLLGPSGCGKTTLLRAIAGFIRQTSGDIRIGGQIINDVPAYKRDAGMVFQNYAVFPHLTVEENIAYGLKARKVVGAEAKRRISDALEMVDLLGFEVRLPKSLSGGQQQRVVIARAIAIQPRVLLMDEPLANLDAKLRVRLRNDLKELQRELGTTTIYVTHDQEEALSLSDQIAVMSKGHVAQVGSPVEIYQRPATLHVANFIGEGNFLTVDLRGREGHAELIYPGGQVLQLPEPSVAHGKVWAGFRPQDADIVPAEQELVDANVLSGEVVFTSFLGSYLQAKVQLAESATVLVQARVTDLAHTPQIGDRIGIRVRPENLMVFSGGDVTEEEL